MRTKIMKLISGFASFSMLFTLTACGQNDSNDDTAAQQQYRSSTGINGAAAPGVDNDKSDNNESSNDDNDSNADNDNKNSNSDGDSYDWNDFEPDNENIAYRDVTPDVNTLDFTTRIISQCDVKINEVDSNSIAYTDGNTSDYCVWNQGQRKWIHKTGDYNTDYHYSGSELGQTYYVNIDKAYKNSDGKWEDTSIGFKDEKTMKAWLQWAKKNNVHYDWSSDQNYP